MKAAAKAPSAKMARKWFGRRKATKKASAIGPAPSTAAITTSRMKPEARETRVRPPTVAIRLIIRGFGPSFPLPAGGREVKQKQRLGQPFPADPCGSRPLAEINSRL